jgi:hypothetical protein
MIRSTFLRCVPLFAAAGAFLGLRRPTPEPLRAEPEPDLADISLAPDTEYVVQARTEGGPWETVKDVAVEEHAGGVSVAFFEPPMLNDTEVEIRVRRA